MKKKQHRPSQYPKLAQAGISGRTSRLGHASSRGPQTESSVNQLTVLLKLSRQETAFVRANRADVFLWRYQNDF